MFKRALAAILALVMIIGLLPIMPASTTAYAEYPNGKCGDNLAWVCYGGILNISGYGDMYDYSYDNRAPWYNQRAEIQQVIMRNDGGDITSIGAWAFSECTHLRLLELSPTLKKIGERAFDNCVSLNDFTLPRGVTTIGSYAFFKCSTLTRVPSDSLLKNVTTLGRGVFMHCTKIEEAVFPPALNAVPPEMYADTGVKQVVIPEQVTYVLNEAFSNCADLRRVFLNTGVTEVRDKAFSGCPKLGIFYISSPLKMGAKVLDGCQSNIQCYIEPTENEFNSKSSINADNTSFKNATKYYHKFYFVVFNPNGGSGIGYGSSKSPQFGGGDFGESIGFLDSPHSECFHFIGWNTKPDGSGKSYLNGSVNDSDKTINLYAQWSDNLTRLSGDTRNGTAVAICDEIELSAGYCGAVVLANGRNFADALAGGPLAYALEAPILLITNDDADNETFVKIRRLDVEDVYILGGTGAIGADVEARLKKDGYNVERIAGDNRFETAVKIAEKMDELRGKYSSRAFFTYSHNYPDALAVSGIAAIRNEPILYIDSDGVLDPATKDYVSKSKLYTSYLIGGTGAISSAAEGNITKAGVVYTYRIAGATRYDTCLEINKEFRKDLRGHTVCVSTGINFPDALAGSVLAALRGAPMILVAPDEPLSTAQKEYLEQYYTGYLGHAYILGGKVAVPEAIEKELRKVIPYNK